MSITEKIKDITVVINEGSGVLVQPMTKDYSYVLTAKHVIQIDKYDPNKGLLDLSNIHIYKSTDEKLIPKKLCPHPVLDIAIIVIDYDSSSIDVIDTSIIQNMKLSLYGYPNKSEQHRNPEIPRREWLETYTLDIAEHSDEEIKCYTNEDVEYDDIEGFSGGGIFYITEKNWFLIGIEHKLHQSGEYANKIISIPIKCFNTVISNFGILPIRPPYYSDFKELKTNIFNYTNCFDINDIKKATDLIVLNSASLLEETTITPFEIITNFEGVFTNLTPNSTPSENRDFWIAFLEFLHIEGLISPEISWDSNFLKYIIRNYKFVYTTCTKGWKTNLSKLLSTNVDNLKNGGVLFFIENSGDYPNKPDTLTQYRDRIPSNVANAIEVEDIANVTSIIDKSISIIHLPKLHHSCIYDLEDTLSELNKITDKDKIKELILKGYLNYIKNKGTEIE
ncbi:ABC-three component system protein [Enterobacter bugandensis]|uniref:ABC-three component system protein n=1 Tax=Enterobacter bugandensis TaxID=881260 RepID=UPI0020042650|nr:ABC-three component system protein [Enterobacter bugandensis]MCK6740163.1 hypothetical protein [Enterobacter bugandensis]